MLQGIFQLPFNTMSNHPSKIGRPALSKGQKKAKPSLTIDPVVYRDLKEASERTGISTSALVTACCRQRLPGLVKALLSEGASIDPTNFLVQHPSEILPTKTHWLDLCGGIAAGSQIPNDAPEEPIAVSKAYDDDCYALRVFGQSMEPKIRDGSLIVVQRMADGTYPKKESIVVYSDAYGLSLKQFVYRQAKGDEDANAFGKVAILKSLNPRFPDVQTMDGGKIEAVFVETLDQ